MHNVKIQFESRTYEAKAPCFGGQFGLGPLQGGKGFADQLLQKVFLAIVDIVQKRGEHLAWHRTTPILYFVICTSLAYEVKGNMGMGELE